MSRVSLLALWVALLTASGTACLTACPLEVDVLAMAVTEESTAAIPLSLSVYPPVGNGKVEVVEVGERLKKGGDKDDSMVWVLLTTGGIVVAMIGGRDDAERILPNSGGENDSDGGGQQNPLDEGNTFPWQPVHTPEPHAAWLLLVTGCLLLTRRHRSPN
ncbi:MAG: hypothetical protein LKKZDAJK_002002 [Candidatus Fervidibacter sp.]